MKWTRVPVFLRIISSVMAVFAFLFAWYLTKIGASGVEDIPPPFILFSGIAGLVFLLIAVIGKFPVSASNH
jgi:hypothetical protein